MIASRYKTKVLIGILVVTVGLLIASCGANGTVDPPPTTRGAEDTLGLNDQPVTLGSRPVDVSGSGLVSQQDDDPNRGTLVTVREVETTFEDQPELAERIDVEQVLAWQQVFGFAERVEVETPNGEELPEQIVYTGATFEARVVDESFEIPLFPPIGAEVETIVLERVDDNIYAFESADADRFARLTTLRIENDEEVAYAQLLFELLTSGSEQNKAFFSLTLDYEIDGNTSIPEGTNFFFTILTEPGSFEVSDNVEEDVR